MKTSILITAIVMFMSLGLQAQKSATSVEVLYFKANLGCCMARTCDALQSDVAKAIKNNFEESAVAFKEVRLNNPENRELVQKYKAGSQTIVIISKDKKGKEQAENVSDLLVDYQKHKQFATFETLLSDKIKSKL